MALVNLVQAVSQGNGNYYLGLNYDKTHQRDIEQVVGWSSANLPEEAKYIEWSANLDSTKKSLTLSSESYGLVPYVRRAPGRIENFKDGDGNPIYGYQLRVYPPGMDTREYTPISLIVDNPSNPIQIHTLNIEVNPNYYLIVVQNEPDLPYAYFVDKTKLSQAQLPLLGWNVQPVTSK